MGGSTGWEKRCPGRVAGRGSRVVRGIPMVMTMEVSTAITSLPSATIRCRSGIWVIWFVVSARGESDLNEEEGGERRKEEHRDCRIGRSLV
ncbi:hypothetical protein E3N88_13777 [Mikania micrantha]|uniref:Uncharacterized protein n=1 Tax=Mikania micrantha TaxID=192012 RepID=A0A5N6P0R5_9ASTR|nr:hypothetical protein E3N88_13777 [Mikania micrantha]